MGRQFTDGDLEIDPLDAARLLLGCVLSSEGPDGLVEVRLTEVEAYRGLDDPASHCYRGKTERNAVMFGPAGRLYVYFVYGMHFCANVVCLTDGVAGAVLLRAGTVVGGAEVAARRRPAARSASELARGPARLTSALGIGREHNGAVLTDPGSPLRLYHRDAVPQICSGPRVGVVAAMDDPWRFWIDGERSVSNYRRGGRKRVVAPAGRRMREDMRRE